MILPGIVAGGYRPAGGGGSDPNFADVSLLLPLSSNFTDLSSNAHTVTPNLVTIDNSVQFFGLYSADFNGSSSLLTLPSSSTFAFPGDFTVEFNFYQESAVDSGVVCLSGGAGTGGFTVRLKGSVTGIQIIAAFAADIGSSANSVYSLNTAHHFAASREGTALRLFVDGVLVQTLTTSYSFTQQDGIIGLERGKAYFNGRLGNIRITKGVARYTASFTPPSAPWPTS